MAAAFFLGQYVNLALELGVGMYGAGLGYDLAALDVGALYAAEQYADVVARDGLIQQLAEHFNAGDYGAALLVGQTDYLDGILYLYGAALYTAGGDGAASGDGEYVLNRHKEGLVGRALGIGYVAVYRVHQLEDALALGGFLGYCAVLKRLESLQRGAADDGDIVAGEIIGAEQLADLHLDQIQKLFVVYLVYLVHEYYDVGHANLTGKQYVLAGLGHGAVRRGNYEDSAVHLGRAGDHVLNIVGMAGAVNVRIVALVGLVLDVCGVDGYSTGLLFGRLVDFVVAHRGSVSLLAQRHGDGGGQGGLAMVYVTYGADVDMGLSAFKFCLCHLNLFLLKICPFVDFPEASPGGFWSG